MKYAVYVLVICLWVSAACHDRQRESTEIGYKQTDTIKAESKAKSAGTGGNQVRSEAPDALTKMEQGYALPRFDNGPAQSPVNILSSGAEKDNKHQIALAFNDEVNAIENLGHTIQLDFTAGSNTIVDGKAYRAKQLHFHTPSEHLIDGMTFPMEMHLVNIAKEQPAAEGTSFVVIGILFKMGAENKFIKEFLAEVPGEEGKKESLRPGTVKLEDLFSGIPKNELGTYYHYKGSLTTPPYTESVDWIIRKYIFEASPEQINAIEKLEGDNARHVQALYRRGIVSN